VNQYTSHARVRLPNAGAGASSSISAHSATGYSVLLPSASLKTENQPGISEVMLITFAIFVSPFRNGVMAA